MGKQAPVKHTPWRATSTKKNHKGLFEAQIEQAMIENQVGLVQRCTR